MLGDKRLIQTIRLKNLLSFGPETEETKLLSLNVLIGPNGSGKSNLIEAIDVLRACPRDLQAPIRTGGGAAEWLWKGNPRDSEAGIEVSVSYPQVSTPLRHSLSFGVVGFRFELTAEAIGLRVEFSDASAAFYKNLHGAGSIASREWKREHRALTPEAISLEQSVVSQVKAADFFPEITYLGREYDKIRLYRGWDTGRQSALRLPQKPDLPQDFLLEDGSNLCLVLNDLQRLGKQSVLVDYLREFHEPITDFHTGIFGGAVQVFLHERGLGQPIPAPRLSDGTLRFLCLLVVLCHPSPPPLICIEEPEIGLHPDILPTVAKLLVDASERTQLIVTTHSNALVDALTDTPEAVVVCEKQEGSTTMRRLSSDALKEWLEKYTLGQLWRKGELGGNRW